ncbi:MAG: phosphoribosylamine--glycine ligase [Patescibacteria group bacterium]|nr:phosphoribosylamine--glycine ligase [Patescibacteria group bacterium]
MGNKKFLFVSKDSLSGDLAIKLLSEGHSVKFYFEDKYSKDVYNGFVEKVDNWKKYISWADMIIFDDENFGGYADKLRKNGKLVVGGSKYTDKLEIDRKFGQAELKKNGIDIVPIWKFNNCNIAIDFIKKNPGRYVYKPSGNGQSGDKRLTLISQNEDGSDLLEFLFQNKRFLEKKNHGFVLQRFIDGIEIAVGAFFNGTDFIYPINVNFEHKHLFQKGLGPMTGEMGTLMFWSNTNKIFHSTLAKMKSSLEKSGYVGYIDLNCIVNEDGIFPLEFTSRFGYPTIQIQLAGILDQAGDWLFKIAKGIKFNLSTKKGFQIGVVVATPPLLSEGDDIKVVKTFRDIAINFKDGTNFKNIHIGDIKKDKNNVWRIAGASGWCLVVTGTGQTVSRAREKAYKEIKNISVSNMFYRGDIGSRWSRESKKLRSWDYI